MSDLENVSLGKDIIPVSASARKLGFIYDSDMSFCDQINSVSCHFHIRAICRICHLLPLSAAAALANSFVHSKLDYCNSLYFGISQANLNKLQRIQNSLARVVKTLQQFQHVQVVHHTNARQTSIKESITNSGIKILKFSVFFEICNIQNRRFVTFRLNWLNFNLKQNFYNLHQHILQRSFKCVWHTYTTHEHCSRSGDILTKISGVKMTPGCLVFALIKKPLHFEC